MCDLTREEFMAKTPTFTGDILFEHLVILQQDAEEAERTSPVNSLCSSGSGDHSVPVDFSSGTSRTFSPQPPPPVTSAGLTSFSEQYQLPPHLYSFPPEPAQFLPPHHPVDHAFSHHFAGVYPPAPSHFGVFPPPPPPPFYRSPIHVSFSWEPRISIGN